VRLPHPEPIAGASYSAVELAPGDAEVVMLDQRRLPLDEEYLRLRRVEEVAVAIETLAVRGAPAIGVAAAYGVVLAAREGDVDGGIARLRRTRPTAVNLAWALDRMARVAPRDVAALASEARAIHREDVAACRAMGRVGAARVPDDATVLTHCNAGALATGGYGSALGVVRAARAMGKRVRVVACETRPVLQGSRLTAWELAKDGFEVTLVTDSMVAQRMRRGGVDLVVVGADRIARSGDVANKIGTYLKALAAREANVPLYVAVPSSSIDWSLERGADVPIEERPAEEVTHVGSARVVPLGSPVRNPAFDVTPARLVTRLITDRGVCEASRVGLSSLYPERA